MQNKQIVPFLKWPGGKRWLAKKYKEYFPKEYNMYIEPFLGSGAVFFSLQPKEAILSDINKELINLYVIMRDNSKELKGQLVYHQERHTKEHYYKIRDAMLTDNLKCAGRLLYLNRACYNGMYRVNKQGKFNVPIGTKNNFTYDIDQFDQYANCLKHATLICGDFYEIINKAKKNDFIFADPPYATSGKANFTKYNDELFVWQDQLRLHEALVNAKARGAKIILTNVYCKEIIEMYKNDGFYVHILQRSSNIAGQADKRGKVKELMITSNRKQSKGKEKHE